MIKQKHGPEMRDIGSSNQIVDCRHLPLLHQWNVGNGRESVVAIARVAFERDGARDKAPCLSKVQHKVRAKGIRLLQAALGMKQFECFQIFSCV